MNDLTQFYQSLGLSVAAVFVYMNAWFAWSLLKKRADIVDVAWGMGFVVIALTLYLQRTEFSARALICLVFVACWGFRLAGHIHHRNHGKPEDFRYKAWREEWGKGFLLRSYLQIFMLQGFFMLTIAASLIMIQAFSQTPLNMLDYLGMAIWGMGFFFEAIGDEQLRRYKQNPANKGRIIQSGLWHYTRHPNYFGEVILWWGLFLMSLSVNHGIYSILSPLIITFLILKVSGIPMLEAKYTGNPDFEAYKARTNAFWPWWPKT